MIKNLDFWIKAAVEFASQKFSDGFTQRFLVDYLNFTALDKQWLNINEKSQSNLIGKELNRLQNAKKIRQATPDEFIVKEKVYLPV